MLSLLEYQHCEVHPFWLIPCTCLVNQLKLPPLTYVDKEHFSTYCISTYHAVRPCPIIVLASSAQKHPSWYIPWCISLSRRGLCYVILPLQAVCSDLMRFSEYETCEYLTFDLCWKDHKIDTSDHREKKIEEYKFQVSTQSQFRQEKIVTSAPLDLRRLDRVIKTSPPLPPPRYVVSSIAHCRGSEPSTNCFELSPPPPPEISKTA